MSEKMTIKQFADATRDEVLDGVWNQTIGEFHCGPTS